jgi:hypothetical protein
MFTQAEINVTSLKLKVAAMRTYLQQHNHTVLMHASYGRWQCEALYVRKELDGQFNTAVYYQHADGTYSEIMINDNDHLIVSGYRESDIGIHLAYKAELAWF